MELNLSKSLRLREEHLRKNGFKTLEFVGTFSINLNEWNESIIEVNSHLLFTRISWKMIKATEKKKIQ